MIWYMIDIVRNIESKSVLNTDLESTSYFLSIRYNNIFVKLYLVYLIWIEILLVFEAFMLLRNIVLAPKNQRHTICLRVESDY